MNNQRPGQLNIFVVLWAAILWSCFLFVGLVFFKFNRTVFDVDAFSGDNNITVIMFLAIAIFNFMAAMLLPKMLLQNANIDSSLSQEDMDKKYFVPFVIKIVLLESASIMGLAASFNLQTNVILPFFIISLIGFVTSFPSRTKVRNEILSSQRRV